MLKYSFFYDNYGLYPIEIIDNTFIIDDYIYKAEEVICDEIEIEKIVYFSYELNKYFKESYILIKNRMDKYIVELIDKKYVLVRTKISKITYKKCLELTNLYVNKFNQRYTIDEMINIWLERFENIKNNCFESIDKNKNNYDLMETAVSFSLGLAENALSYLADTKLDYGTEIERLSLCHKRLNSLDSYSFFNPFNLIIDSIVRDYAELYKFELIDIYDLDNILSNLNLTQKEASLLMARILYPTRIFDIIEDNYLLDEHKINQNNEYLNNLNVEYQRIKNVNSLLKIKYNIRPIEWLKK